MSKVYTEVRIPDAERSEFLKQAEQFVSWYAGKEEFALSRAEVRSETYRQLRAIETSGGGKMEEVAEALDLTAGQAGRVVVELAKQGWVKTIGSSEDKRPRRVEVTEEGKKMLALCKQVKEEVMARVVCSKDQKARERMLEALKELNGLGRGVADGV